jgi:hypothetical protein
VCAQVHISLTYAVLLCYSDRSQLVYDQLYYCRSLVDVRAHPHMHIPMHKYDRSHCALGTEGHMTYFRSLFPLSPSISVVLCTIPHHSQHSPHSQPSSTTTHGHSLATTRCPNFSCTPPHSLFSHFLHPILFLPLPLSPTSVYFFCNFSL